MRRYRLYISSLTITVLLTAVLVLTGCDAEKPTVTAEEQTLLAPGGVDKILVINKYSNGVLSVGEPAAEAEAFHVVDYLVFLCHSTGDNQVEVTHASAVAYADEELGEDSYTLNFIRFCENVINGTAGALNLRRPDIGHATCTDCGDLSATVSATIPDAGIVFVSGVYPWDGTSYPYIGVVQSDGPITLEQLAAVCGYIPEVSVITQLGGGGQYAIELGYWID